MKKKVCKGLITVTMAVTLFIGFTVLQPQQVAAASKITASTKSSKAGTVKVRKKYTVNVKGNTGGLKFVAPKTGRYYFQVSNYKSKGIKASKDLGDMDLYLQSPADYQKTINSKAHYYMTGFKRIDYYMNPSDAVATYSRKKAYIENIGSKSLCKLYKTDKKKNRYYREAEAYVDLKEGENYIIVTEGVISGKKGYSFSLYVYLE